jgi:hypothetical protein
MNGFSADPGERTARVRSSAVPRGRGEIGVADIGDDRAAVATMTSAARVAAHEPGGFAAQQAFDPALQTWPRSWSAAPGRTAQPSAIAAPDAAHETADRAAGAALA